jgi:hypothetical protein
MRTTDRRTPASCWRRAAASRDEGAGSVEYLGATMFVAVIIMSLLMPATPLGNQIAAKLCAAFGTTCGSDTAGPAVTDGPPEGTVHGADGRDAPRGGRERVVHLARRER